MIDLKAFVEALQLSQSQLKTACQLIRADIERYESMQYSAAMSGSRDTSAAMAAERLADVLEALEGRARVGK